MKKYQKNAKNTGKVYEKILKKCKKNWKSQGNSSVQKSGNHACTSILKSGSKNMQNCSKHVKLDFEAAIPLPTTKLWFTVYVIRITFRLPKGVAEF